MKVKLINIINGKVVATLALPKPEENSLEEDSIECVGFCKTQSLIACATLSGQIFVWDLNTHVLRNKLSYTAGFSKIIWSNKETLYASTLDGNVFSYDGRNLELIKKYSGHESDILDFYLENNYLFTASNDNDVKIFEINH
jgi:WD40 repeat protein